MIWLSTLVIIFFIVILIFSLRKGRRITNKFFIKNQLSSFIQTGILVLAFTVFFSFLIGSFSYLNNNDKKLKDDWSNQKLTQNYVVNNSDTNNSIELKVDQYDNFITKNAFQACTDAQYGRSYRSVKDIPIKTNSVAGEVGIGGEELKTKQDWEDNKYLYAGHKINFCLYKYVKDKKDPIFYKYNYKINLNRIVTFFDFNHNKRYFIYDAEALFDKKSNQYMQNIPILENSNVKLPKGREIFLHKRYADLNNIKINDVVNSSNSSIGTFIASNLTKFNPNIINSLLPVTNQKNAIYKDFFVGGVSRQYFNEILLGLKNTKQFYRYTMSLSFYDNELDFRNLNLILPLLNQKFANSSNYIIDPTRDNSHNSNFSNIFMPGWKEKDVKIIVPFNSLRNFNNFYYLPTMYTLAGTTDLSFVFSIIIVLILIIMIFIFLRIIIIKRQNIIGVLKALGYNSKRIAFSLSLSFLILILFSFLLSFAFAPIFSLFWNNLIFNGILFTKAAIFNFPDIAFISLFFIVVPIIIIYLLVKRRTKKLLVRDLIYETSVVKQSFLVEKTTPLFAKLPFAASYPLKNVLANLTRASSIFIFSFITIFIFMFIFATLNVFPNFRSSFNANYNIDNVDVVQNDTRLAGDWNVEFIDNEQAGEIVNNASNEYKFGFTDRTYQEIMNSSSFSEFFDNTEILDEEMLFYLQTEEVDIKNYFKIKNMKLIRDNLKKVMIKGANYCYSKAPEEPPTFFDLIDPKLPDCDRNNVVKAEYISSVIFISLLKYSFDRIEFNLRKDIDNNSSIFFNKTIFNKDSSSFVKVTTKNYSNSAVKNQYINLNGIDERFGNYVKYKDSSNGLGLFSSLKKAREKYKNEIPAIISDLAFKILKLKINDVISFNFKKMNGEFVVKKFRIIAQVNTIESWNLYYINDHLEESTRFEFDQGQSNIFIGNSDNEKKQYFGITSPIWKSNPIRTLIAFTFSPDDILGNILNSPLLNLQLINIEASAKMLLSTLTRLFDTFLDFISIFIVILIFNFILLLFTLSYQILLKSDKDKEILKKLGFSTTKNVNTITSPVIFLNILAVVIFLPIAILIINLVRNFIWTVTFLKIPIYLSTVALALVIIFYILFNIVFWLISYFGVRKKKKD